MLEFRFFEPLPDAAIFFQPSRDPGLGVPRGGHLGHWGSSGLLVRFSEFSSFLGVFFCFFFGGGGRGLVVGFPFHPVSLDSPVFCVG